METKSSKCDGRDSKHLQGLKGSKGGLKDNIDLPITQADLNALDPKINTDKPGIRAGLRNNTAIAQLTMVFQTASLLDKVNQAKSTD